MVLDKATNLKRYAQSCWGLATREWHFIEPVTRGYMVRNCAFFILDFCLFDLTDWEINF